MLGVPAAGPSGDIIVDLSVDSSFNVADCGSEVVEIYYSAISTCGEAATAVQTTTREDTEAPTLDGPNGFAVECDAVPAAMDLNEMLSTGVLSGSDNCEDSDEPLTYAYEGEVVTSTDCDSEYSLTRTWVATDCSGNARS
mgnify:CR=1 FL=1